MRKAHTSNKSETGKNQGNINAVAEWRGRLTGVTAALLAFELLSGGIIYLFPFSLFNQIGVLTHTLAGLLLVLPLVWFIGRHWWVRRLGNLSHYQLLGYIALVLLLACMVSGLVLTWQAALGPAIDYRWDAVHLVSGIGLVLFLLIHLVTVILRKTGQSQSARSLRQARRVFYRYSVLGGLGYLVTGAAWALIYEEPVLTQGYPDDYNWRFGEDRPFAPSLARLDQSAWRGRLQNQVLDLLTEGQQADYREAFARLKGEAHKPFQRIRLSLRKSNPELAQDPRLEALFRDAAEQLRSTGSVKPQALAGSAACGSSGCHEQIYQEWLPSAHRYSSLDDMFQRVQRLMVAETAPEYTRYCAGCHDPISLFSGAKDQGNITLSTEGSHEGSSCIVCHSIVQTDLQGNGDYTIRPPQRYVYELHPGPGAKFISDFLIRSYPKQHLDSYSRPLYRTPEFCAACHKQYVDKEVNIDIGKVQGQNQYDSWKNSRWYHEGEPEKTLTCRECHMPLQESTDPARGDSADAYRSPNDNKHRSHRTLAANQYIPVLQNLEGGLEHAELTEQWLRGELEIPEIADRWTAGPVIRMHILAPQQVAPGEETRLQVVLTNNKTGHDFPTGPLDMLESWVEITVNDGNGNTIYHAGGLDAGDRANDPPLSYRADGFDRQGKLIDRHNLWDMVGASYKRSLYPGMSDTAEARFKCPSLSRGRLAGGDVEPGSGQRIDSFTFAAPAAAGTDQLEVSAVLWYRKANPDFLDRVYGEEAGMRSPLTEISRASARIQLVSEVHGPQ